MELIGLQDFFHITLLAYSALISAYCTQKVNYLGRRIRILSIIGQLSLLVLLFVVLASDFRFSVTGIPYKD
tara:strand:+ start:518 stop:730 length:213 start_codon:yes stop_codon:yes gene_type:complete